jgi:hypothetical protein
MLPSTAKPQLPARLSLAILSILDHPPTHPTTQPPTQGEGGGFEWEGGGEGVGERGDGGGGRGSQTRGPGILRGKFTG